MSDYDEKIWKACRSTLIQRLDNGWNPDRNLIEAYCSNSMDITPFILHHISLPHDCILNSFLSNECWELIKASAWNFITAHMHELVPDDTVVNLFKNRIYPATFQQMVYFNTHNLWKFASIQEKVDAFKWYVDSGVLVCIPDKLALAPICTPMVFSLSYDWILSVYNPEGVSSLIAKLFRIHPASVNQVLSDLNIATEVWEHLASEIIVQGLYDSLNDKYKMMVELYI